MKVATYNIHSCIDTRGMLDMRKTAAVIADLGADIVALQEVDNRRLRTGGIHQARWLARRLKMDFVYFPVLVKREEQYGLAVLTSIPMRTVKFERLPVVRVMGRRREPRGALWVLLATPQGNVHLVNTHLGLLARERRPQIEILLGDDWLGGIPEYEPVIFCGDFNAGRGSYVYRRITMRFSDVQRLVNDNAPPVRTFPSYYPIASIDHIFVSRHFHTLDLHIPSAVPARTASDHLPVVAALALAQAGQDSG